MDHLPFIIGGKPGYSDETIEVLNPYSGTLIARVCKAGPDDIKRALESAVRGAEMMADIPACQRAAMLHRLAGLMEESADALTDTIITEGGKVRRYAAAEVARAIGTIRLSAEEATRIKGEMIPFETAPAGEGRIAFTTRFPVGIVLAITPFNFPLNQICHKAGPAIAAGNACIIKPASTTPMTALLFGELMRKAGIPDEAVSVIPSSPTDAELMVRDPRIGTLSFTGSPEVGWYLRSVTSAGKVTLELGGNAAVIVHHDADIPSAAARIVEGAFSHAGQVCISVQRVFVHQSVKKQLVQEIAMRTEKLLIGDPDDPETDIGPMIRPDKTEEALKRIQAAVSGGADVMTGNNLCGTVLTPTVLIDTTPDMDVNCREAFAPVLTITPYESFEDAINQVNNSRYGLQTGVYTRSIERAFHAYRKIRTGAVLINDIPTFRIDSMPYGGVKESGIGREGPAYAILEMTEERMIIIKT